MTDEIASLDTSTETAELARRLDGRVAAAFWVHGDDPRGTAEEWVGRGFTAAGAEAWLDAGCFDAAVARRLAAAGITPERAGRCVELDDGRRITLVTAVCEGDLDLSAAMAYLEQGSGPGEGGAS